MDINKKLKHLTAKQIEEVVQKYEDNVKIIDIIKEYKIDVTPSGFYKILPPSKTNVSCIYCGNDMYKKRVSRSSYSYSDSNQILFCDNCGHTVYPEIWSRIYICECENCVAYRKRIVEEKQEKINSLYGNPKEKINFTDMEFRNQIDLIFVLLNNPKKDTYEILPVNIYDKNKKK